MRVNVQPTVLSLRLEVHSAAATAIPLPGNARVWIPEDVRLNDAPSNALSRDPAGNLWLQIPAGVHQLLLTGGLPHRAQVQVSLPLKPHIVEIGRMDVWTYGRMDVWTVGRCTACGRTAPSRRSSNSLASTRTLRRRGKTLSSRPSCRHLCAWSEP